MSASSATAPSPVLQKSSMVPASGEARKVASDTAKPRRPPKRAIALSTIGLIGLAAASYWFVVSSGYETTDDATIEAHVVQVSPKVSAHVKSVHFDDNYQVKRGDLLIELDPRDFEVSLASANAALASAGSKLTQAEAQRNVAQAGLGQVKADLISA
ncbi:MAG: biotin/lipoyl-binding protein, partial [Verrucomicrobia bacterium]|nr:biotin/lipoyl-binding protein [Verrucomicrobiota bacterium]